MQNPVRGKLISCALQILHINSKNFFTFGNVNEKKSEKCKKNVRKHENFYACGLLCFAKITCVWLIAHSRQLMGNLFLKGKHLLQGQGDSLCNLLRGTEIHLK